MASVDNASTLKDILGIRKSQMLTSKPMTSVTEIKEQMKAMNQEQIDCFSESGYSPVLGMCGYNDDELYEMVLEAVSDKAVASVDYNGSDALSYALLFQNKKRVMMLLERLTDEQVAKTRADGYTRLHELFSCEMVGNKEVVDVIAGKVPVEMFYTMMQDGDSLAPPLTTALLSESQSGCAVSVCLERAPDLSRMEKEMEEQLYFARLAASKFDVDMVERLVEAIPILEDGSGLRGSKKAYAGLVNAAVLNEDSCQEIIEYVVGMAGDDVLAECNPLIFNHMESIDEYEYVVTRCPELLKRAISLVEEERCVPLFNYMLEVQDDVVAYLCEKVLEAACHSDIVKGLQRVWSESIIALEPLFKALPEAWNGRQRLLLNEAIDYENWEAAEICAAACSQDDLRARNEDGDRPLDLAKRQPDVPDELLEVLTPKPRAKNASVGN